MSTFAARFWAIAEMHLVLALYLEQEMFRVLMCTSWENFHRFLEDGWCRVTGIGNLLATLHPTLGRPGIGLGQPNVEIPDITQFQQAKIDRFLLYAGAVQRLKVNSNPDRFVRWTRLDRLLSLAVHAGRETVLPNVTHFSIEVSRRYKQVELAPFIQLLANPRLQQVWVSPNRSLHYPRSTVVDADNVLSVLISSFGNEQPLQWLSYYPEDMQLNRAMRDSLTQRFASICQNLCYFTTSIWFVSIPLLVALSSVPLVRFEIQGRAPVPHEDLTMIREVDFPDNAFATLRFLLLQDVSLLFARNMLLAEPITANVEFLRIEVCDIDEVDMDVEVDVLWAALFQRVAAFTHLRELTMASPKPESGRTQQIPMTFLQPIIEKQLTVLRLFRFGISDSQGFTTLCNAPAAVWQNLTMLWVMHQNIWPQDLWSLAQLPHLNELGANVTTRLGQPVPEEPTLGFARRLIFTTQFRFNTAFLKAHHTGYVTHIVKIFDEGSSNDQRDFAWAHAIVAGLRRLGKTVPALQKIPARN
ncbi:hypothetical protein RSOL_284780, partial [Rhizoctonia solani AG-3 Rhs1AP]